MTIDDDYPLSIEEFRAWLESKDENEIVGSSNCLESCPISNALKQGKYKFNEVLVDDEGETRLNDWIIWENPDWVYSFVDKVDSFGEGEEVQVTAQQALELLENIL